MSSHIANVHFVDDQISHRDVQTLIAPPVKIIFSRDQGFSQMAVSVQGNSSRTIWISDDNGGIKQFSLALRTPKPVAIILSCPIFFTEKFPHTINIFFHGIFTTLSITIIFKQNQAHPFSTGGKYPEYESGFGLMIPQWFFRIERIQNAIRNEELLDMIVDGQIIMRIQAKGILGVNEYSIIFNLNMIRGNIRFYFNFINHIPIKFSSIFQVH